MLVDFAIGALLVIGTVGIGGYVRNLAWGGIWLVVLFLFMLPAGHQRATRKADRRARQRARALWLASAPKGGRS